MKTIWVPAAFILAAAAVIQASAGEAASVYGIKPSLIFITVYALAIRAGEWRGLLYGAAGGLVEDCLSGGLLGLMLSGNALAGFLAGRLGSRVFNIGEMANFAGIFLLSLAQGTYTAAAVVTLISGGELTVAVAYNALPQALANAVAGTVLLWLVGEETPVPQPLAGIVKRIQVRL